MEDDPDRFAFLVNETILSLSLSLHYPESHLFCHTSMALEILV